MKEDFLTLDEYRKSHAMDLDTVLQMGLDICQILEKGEAHGEITMDGLLVTDEWQFVFDDEGEKRPSDTATDVYSLGMMMYRLLNKGRLPFMPPYPQKMSKEEKEQAVKRCLSGEAFPMPLNGNEGLLKVLQKACHADRAMRYESPGAMRADLEAVIAALPDSNARLRSGKAEEKTAAFPDIQKEDGRWIIPPDEQEKRQEKLQILEKEEEEEPAGFSVGPGLAAILSAVLSIAFIYYTKQISFGNEKGLVLFGFALLQLILTFVSMGNPGLLVKLLNVVTVVDLLYTALDEIFLEKALAELGFSVPRGYAPGYIGVLLPIAVALVVLVGVLIRRPARWPVFRIFTIVMLLASVLLLVMNIIGFNYEIAALEINLYPLVLAGAIILFALLAIECETSGIGVKFMSFLVIALTILFMIVLNFESIVVSMKIPANLTRLGIHGLMILFSLLCCFGKVRRRDREYWACDPLEKGNE